jgi:two-component system cell cycle response regulator
MGETILVVDDEPTNRELLEAILTDAGYRVVLAQDGQQALSLIAASPPDLILLDLMMPGMSGLEVCEALKRDGRSATIPIIVVTALGQVATKEAALTWGADDFVIKPVQSQDLRARVTAMLKVRAVRQELDRTLAYLHELEAARQPGCQAALAQVVAGETDRPAQVVTPVPILLVDDDALTRGFYRDLLSEHGFQVREASSGEEALRLLEQHAFDAAVLDIVMPDMSGLQLLDHLKRQDPDLPAIMLTGHVTSQNAIAALKLGAFDFLVKGLDQSLVVLALHRAVRHRREAVARRQEIERLRQQLRDAVGSSR